MFAASGESTAWVLLWKTRSRPIGVRVCPEAQFNIFSTAFDSRAWTDGCVLVKEILGRQPQPITPENEAGDETNYPSPATFIDDPDVPGGPPEPPGPPDPSPAGDRERMEPGSPSRDRVPLRPSQRGPQLIPTLMNDGDDDQPPQEERPNFSISEGRSSKICTILQLQRKVNEGCPFETRLHIEYFSNDHFSQLSSESALDCCFLAIHS